jgi:hypothetical protein
VAGGWRKLHNEELLNLCPSRNTMRVIKSRRIGWAGHVAQSLVGNLKGRDHLEDLGVDGMTILEWILEEQDGNM